VTALVLGGTALIAGGPDASTDRNVTADAPAQLPPPASLPSGKPGKPEKPESGSTTIPSAGSTSPAVQPSSAQPTQSPTQSPTHGPTHQPTQDPTQDPTPDPTAVDMRVSATKAGVGPAAVVLVEVAGLAPGQPGTVTVTADQLTASLNLDPHCTLLGINAATCRVVGPGRLQMLAAGLGILTPTTLTITASPGTGLHDPAMGDNTAHLMLG
jgi:hypothetical protein